MSVDVGIGRALIQITNTNLTPNKTYKVMFDSDGVYNVPISTADPTNPRKDIIVMKIDVSQNPDAGAGNICSIIVQTGTPAVSPVAPSVPANCILLATIAVAAGATSVVTGNITDGRSFVQVNAAVLLDIARATETAALRNDTPTWLGTVSGTNTLTGTATPAPTALVAGQRFAWIVANNNTGSVTLNPNGLGAITLKKVDGATNLAANDLKVGQLAEGRYDGTNIQLTSPPGQSSSTTTKKTMYVGASDSGSFGTGSNTTITAFDTHNFPIPANDLINGVTYEFEGIILFDTGTTTNFYVAANLGTDLANATIASVAAASGNVIKFRARVSGTAAAGGSVAVRSEIDLICSNGSSKSAYASTTLATNGGLTFQIRGQFVTGNATNSAKMVTALISKHASTAF
jgi:hypothetical protein